MPIVTLSGKHGLLKDIPISISGVVGKTKYACLIRMPYGQVRHGAELVNSQFGIYILYDEVEAEIRNSHPLDKNIPFYRCQRFFYPGLLSQSRL